MFGGPLDPPTKPKLQPKPGPEFKGILNPSVHPGHYGYYAREPNSNYKTRLMLYKQRNYSLERESMAAENERVKNEYYRMKFQWNTEKKWHCLNIRSQVNQKLKEYDEELDRKRERLRELLGKEEREEVRETVDNLQKGEELKHQEMKMKAKKIAAEREAERLKIVEEKRIQQYADRAEDLRPALAKKHLIESKTIQLQQMRENEARREAEKEWNSMWEDAMNRELKARTEREEQDCLSEYTRKLEDLETLQNQIRGKQLAKLEALKSKEEDRIEMEKFGEKMRLEKIEEMAATRKKKIAMAEELRNQIKFQERVHADRAAEESKLDDALIYLSQLEYEREKNKFEDTTAASRQERIQYRSHLRELERERKEEEKKLDETLAEYRKGVEKKQDEARCKLLQAKQKLLQDVLKERDEQLKYKKEAAEQQMKEKEEENELCRLTYETHKKLCEESARLRGQAAAEYRDELCKQIDYNNLIRQREKEDLERRSEIYNQEEEKYRKMVQGFLSNDYETGEKHPFRRVFDRYDCRCPKLKDPK
ncbi:hypothetical protein Trydic_g2229 [Trypoxylus dichotomus]